MFKEGELSRNSVVAKIATAAGQASVFTVQIGGQSKV